MSRGTQRFPNPIHPVSQFVFICGCFEYICVFPRYGVQVISVVGPYSAGNWCSPHTIPSDKNWWGEEGYYSTAVKSNLHNILYFFFDIFSGMLVRTSSERWLLASIPETIGGMSTSFRGNDFCDGLCRQALLLMIG